MRGIRLFYISITVFAVLAGQVLYSGTASAEEPLQWETDLKKIKNPNTYGTVVMDKFTKDAKDTRPVVFPHWAHRGKYTCKACHADLGIKMKRLATGIKQADLEAGKYCAKCHDGKTSFGISDCTRCHSYGLPVAENRTIDAISGDLPKDFFGNKVDWAAAVKDGKIKPAATPEGTGEMKQLDLDVIIPAAKFTPHPPDVMFPHKTHTAVIDCATCHTAIFAEKKGGNPDMSMVRIMAGQYCGTCHAKVAFPLDDCFRCHSQPPPKVIEPPKEVPGEDKKEKK